MNKKEKTLALANLMKYDLYQVTEESDWFYMKVAGGDVIPFEPYEETIEGRAQFATILLSNSGEFIAALPQIIEHHSYAEPTQEIILDVILRMNGVEL